MYSDQLNYNILYSVCIFSFKLRLKATEWPYNENRNELMNL